MNGLWFSQSHSNPRHDDLYRDSPEPLLQQSVVHADGLGDGDGLRDGNGDGLGGWRWSEGW